MNLFGSFATQDIILFLGKLTFSLIQNHFCFFFFSFFSPLFKSVFHKNRINTPNTANRSLVYASRSKKTKRLEKKLWLNILVSQIWVFLLFLPCLWQTWLMFNAMYCTWIAKEYSVQIFLWDNLKVFSFYKHLPADCNNSEKWIRVLSNEKG